MIKIPDCKNCIKNDVCEHRFHCGFQIKNEIALLINEVRNKTPFEVEILMEFTCKSFAESVESSKSKPKFTRQEVIDNLKELADKYKLTLFVSENGCGSTSEQVRVIFYDWSFGEKLLVLHFDLLKLADDWFKDVEDCLSEKMIYRMNFHTEDESND